METSVVQTFSHEEFGEIRTVIINGEICFVVADACKILDIKNPSQAIANFPDDEKGICTIYTLGGPQQMNVVTEPGLYRLIFMSRKPNAKKFQRWVFHEVLPQIRQTGTYSVYGNSYFPPTLSARWADVKSAEILVKISKMTESKKARKYLINRAAQFIDANSIYIDIDADVEDDVATNTRPNKNGATY